MQSSRLVEDGYHIIDAAESLAVPVRLLTLHHYDSEWLQSLASGMQEKRSDGQVAACLQYCVRMARNDSCW